MKECFKCHEIKPLNCFYRHDKMFDGYLNKCKECNKKDVKKNRLSKIEYYRAYDRIRGNRITPEKQLQWRSKNLAKYQAQTLIHNLIRAKKIIRKPCEICAERKTHAHHDDYLKPFVVRWLCAAHHSQWHKINGEGKNGKVNLKDHGIKSINNFLHD